MDVIISILTDPFTWVFFACYAALLVADAAIPGYRQVRISGWRLRGLLWFGFSLVLSTALPFLWDGWLAEHTLLDLTGAGVVGGSLVGLLVAELLIYAWHRALHAATPLWRSHQLHHAAERMDIYSAFHFHPTDLVGFGLATSLGLVGVLGLDPLAVAIAATAINLLAIVQHANLRTPHWLGYLIARPEMHMLHHQCGEHRWNYSDLPVIDMLFGTYRNPRTLPHLAYGFYDGASRRVPAMLAYRDVTVDPTAPRRPLDTAAVARETPDHVEWSHAGTRPGAGSAARRRRAG